MVNPNRWTRTVAIISGLALAVVLGACNPYNKFYTPTPNLSLMVTPSDFAKPVEPVLIAGIARDRDDARLYEAGYVMIGTASFNAQLSSLRNESALALAWELEADRVVVYETYTGTVAGVVPLTVPNTQTSYFSGRVSGYGGGSTRFSGSATTYGTSTTYIPYSHRYYDHYATYWRKLRHGRKLKPPGLGIYVRQLSPQQRRDSGGGIEVVLIPRGSAAFKSDLLGGDIIRSIGTDEIVDARSMFSVIPKYYGRKTTFTVIRSGREIDLTIDIPSLEKPTIPGKAKGYTERPKPERREQKWDNETMDGG